MNDSKPRVVVALPTTGQIHGTCADSITRMIHSTTAADTIAFWWNNGQPHDRCRNFLIDRFVSEPGWTHLLFADTDVGVNPDALDRLLSHDAAIACAPVPTLIRRYGPPDEPSGATVSTNIMVFDDPSLRGGIVAPESPNTGYRRMDPDDFPGEGPFHCDATGMGLCLIRRDVFENVERPWCAFVGQFDDEQVGEDIYFFRKARAAGYDILVDPGVGCDHFKPIDLTHLDLLYTDKLPISSWPRLATPNESRRVLVAIRMPRSGWLQVRLLDTLHAWQNQFGDNIAVERLFADTIRGGFVELAGRMDGLDERFTHVLMLTDDVVPHARALGLLASVDAPIVGAMARRLMDGTICWNYWTRDLLSGELVSPQNVNLPDLTEPFEVNAIEPDCMLIQREALRHVPEVIDGLHHGPGADRVFVRRWCESVTGAAGQMPVQIPLTVERRIEVGLAGMLGIKLKLKQRLRDAESSRSAVPPSGDHRIRDALPAMSPLAERLHAAAGDAAN